jgi:hypothetical protein
MPAFGWQCENDNCNGNDNYLIDFEINLGSEFLQWLFC